MVPLPEQVHYGPYCMQAAGQEHLHTTLAQLRPEDAAEANYVETLAGGQKNAQQLVYESFQQSPVRYALLRGQCTLGVGGLCPLPQALIQGALPGGAQAWWVPWMVGTTSLNRFPGGFGAIAAFFRREVQPRFPHLCNMVAWPEQRNRMLLPAWLAAMGFTVQALPAATNHAQGWCAAVFYCLPEAETLL
ncbi:hypothetical protein [Desulfovibrio cuneatus]|uniref:hypothetical protein n=1 Tax=Desulfovibrio cuneatus TaxID=159728 RepID=UPI0004022AB7|nr:hypothetical protein [Desulfovibrio cuneatus]